MAKIILPNPPKVYIVRSYYGGVHIADLVEYNETTRHAKLANGHRIWRWRGGNTLTDLAIQGASMTDYTRISAARRCSRAAVLDSGGGT